MLWIIMSFQSNRPKCGVITISYCIHMIVLNVTRNPWNIDYLYIL